MRLHGLEHRLGDPRRRVATIAARVEDLVARARRALARRVVWDRRELGRLQAELARHEPRVAVAAAQAGLARSAERLRRTMERRLQGLRADLEREAARLDVLSPLACLERGYAIVRRDDATAAVVRDAGTLAAGETVRVVLARGRARARIESTQE
jgi:exodeoxyribonuclease VII large subunit